MTLLCTQLLKSSIDTRIPAITGLGSNDLYLKVDSDEHLAMPSLASFRSALSALALPRKALAFHISFRYKSSYRCNFLSSFSPQ